MSLLPPDSLPVPVFNALPGATLLLSPEFVILGASDDYLAATLTTREQLVGRLIFDVFPDNPATPEANSSRNLRASLAQVLATGQPHQMAPQHYDVPDPDHPGRFVERHWLCTNRPVLGADGRVTHVLHAATDVTARRVAEQQLRDSQAAEQAARAETEAQRRRLYHILENFPAVVASYRGTAHVFDLVSHRFQRDFPTRTIKGLPVREALPELEGQQYYEILDGVYQTGEPFYGTELETWVDLTGTGQLELQYYNVCFQATHDAEGRIDGILNFAYDVTDAVLARQQLQQLNQELEARVQEGTREALALQADLLATAQHQTDERALLYQVFEQTPACIALLRGPEHRFEYINQAYQELFPERELVGRALAEALPDAVDQGFLALLDGVYRTGETFFGNELPLAIAQPDGRPPRQAYFTFTYQAYREHGQVAGISIFAFDVAEQVRARQEREAERQQLHNLFMEAPAPIVILDGPDQVFQLVNPAYQRAFPGRALLGKPVCAALPELAGTPVLDQLQRVYETGEPYVAQELPLMMARHDGAPLEELFFSFTFQARRNARGDVDGVLLFGHEVTDQVHARRVVEEGGQRARALAAELTESNQQLVRTNVDLDNFIYTASHDLKAPISNIEGLLYLLQEELPPAVAQEADIAPTLTRMLDAVERFKRTIEHLTDVSKLQKEHAPDATLINLAAVVEDVRQDLAPLLQATGAKLVVDVSAVPPVQFSEKNLRSVVYNLLSNAVKYRSPDRAPHVDVRGHVRDGHTVLEVHDNGLGIAAHQLPRLFGMFQRFHDHVEGTGIGLYMVKRMVENNGGRLEVHSQLGAGTTFFVFLPHHAARPGAAPFPAFIPS